MQMWKILVNGWTENRVPITQERERPEGAERVCNLIGRTTVSNNYTPRASKDLTTNKRVHMERPMAPAAYLAEEGLVGHQWAKVLDPVNAYCPSVGECPSSEARVGG